MSYIIGGFAGQLQFFEHQLFVTVNPEYFARIVFSRITIRDIFAMLKLHDWCMINRSYSTPCKKAKFEHLQIFSGLCLEFSAREWQDLSLPFLVPGEFAGVCDKIVHTKMHFMH